jgi:hypothetical protein
MTSITLPLAPAMGHRGKSLARSISCKLGLCSGQIRGLADGDMQWSCNRCGAMRTVESPDMR